MHPVVVTLALDDATQERLDHLRQQHFPPERNRVPAHLSLFHALPGAHLEDLLGDVRRLAPRPPFPVRFERVLRLGRGTALACSAPELLEVHRQLAAGWLDRLTPQDRQPLRPHVTVQNKVSPEQARALAEALEAGFEPWSGTAVGVDLWWYLGGPWRHVERVLLGAAPSG